MKLQSILLAAAALVPVLASERAAGWEIIMFYDIYRMDGYRPESDRTIALGCKSKTGKARCDFIDFVLHVSAQNYKLGKEKVSRLNPASIPAGFDRDNPTPAAASKIIEWQGYENKAYGKNPKIPPEKDHPYLPGYDGAYDSQRLLGKLKENGDKHGDVLEKMGKVAQDSRKAAGSAGERLLQRINLSLDQVILGREADNADSLIRDLKTNEAFGLKKYMSGGSRALDPEIEIHTKDTKHELSGETYKVIDSDRLVADIDSRTDIDAATKTAIKDSINDYVTNYTVETKLSEKGGSSGVTHHADIKSATRASSMLKAPLPDCSG